MSKSKIFLYSCLFFILGIFIASIFFLDFYFIFFICAAVILFLLIGIKNKHFFIFGLLIIFLVLGILRYQFSVPAENMNMISYYNGQKVEFAGLINKEPDQREDLIRYEIKTQKILLDNEWQAISGKVLVTNFLFPEYKYGDFLQISCNLQKPEKINDFAYDKYLARYNIYAICYYPKIEVLSENRGNFLLAEIYKIKTFFVSRLNKVLPEPHSSFLAGLLIGAKKSIPADLQAVFNKTGTTHIVAVSGFNVTIIVTFLMLVLNSLAISRKKSFWLVNLGLIFFVVITGFQASILRAAIMGFLVILANYLGRLNRIINALVFAAALMLIINPKLLVYDMGFQLSFLATLGLVYLQPILAKICQIDNIKNKFLKIVLGDYFCTTIAAIIMTTPIIMYNFGKVSIVAPLANILVLPFIPLAMLFGFICSVFSLISLQIGWFLGWFVWLILSYIIWILEKLSGLNWAYFEFDRISYWLMIILYLF
ncbi:ComEC family competence protein, partial [Candidatus Falkowbacteria bacterium]|nr:ComEC family competence protein [Candidatus Falkowbacteria bacterium]